MKSLRSILKIFRDKARANNARALQLRLAAAIDEAPDPGTRSTYAVTLAALDDAFATALDLLEAIELHQQSVARCLDHFADGDDDWKKFADDHDALDRDALSTVSRLFGDAIEKPGIDLLASVGPGLVVGYASGKIPFKDELATMKAISDYSKQGYATTHAHMRYIVEIDAAAKRWAADARSQLDRIKGSTLTHDCFPARFSPEEN